MKRIKLAKEPSVRRANWLVKTISPAGDESVGEYNTRAMAYAAIKRTCRGSRSYVWRVIHNFREAFEK